MRISPVNYIQHRLHFVSRTFQSSDALELIFRVAAKAIKFYIELFQRHSCNAWNKLQLQFQESSEFLGALQIVHSLKEITCPDKNGRYFYKKYSKYKCLNKIFLLFYMVFMDIRMLKKIGFIQFQKIEQVVFWNITRLRCAISGTYIFYHIFHACEGIRSKIWWKVAISVGKVVMSILEILITAKKIQFVPCLFLIRGLSLGIDSFDMSKKIGVL